MQICKFRLYTIVNTIGSIDDLIENYIKIKNKLIYYGEIKYLSKILDEYIEIEVSKLNIKYGTSLPQSKRNKGNVPLFASNGISDYINIFNATDSIVFGCRGTLGNVFYHKGELFVLNTAFYIENPKNYGNLYFALKSNKGLTLYQSGAAQPQITIDAIKNAVLKLPVGESLNNILDSISKYEDLIDNLSKIKQNLLSKYF